VPPLRRLILSEHLINMADVPACKVGAILVQYVRIRFFFSPLPCLIDQRPPEILLVLRHTLRGYQSVKEARERYVIMFPNCNKNSPVLQQMLRMLPSLPNDMTMYILTAIWLPPGGSSTVHI